MRYKQLFIAAITVVAIVAGGWALLKSIPASRIYQVEAEFSDFPPDDDALEEWLRSQPGVVDASAGRRAGEPKVLVVILIIVRNGWGHPPFPDLGTKCDELGYRGRVGQFRDSTGEGGISPRSTGNGRAIGR